MGLCSVVIMWFVRALLCCSVLSLSLQQDVRRENPEDLGDADFMHYLNLYSKVAGLEDPFKLTGKAWSKDLFKDYSAKELENLSDFIHKFLRLVSSILPKEVGKQGTEINELFHNIKNFVDHAELVFGMTMSLTEPKNFARYFKLFYKKTYLTRLDSFLEYLQTPVSGRSTYSSLLFDYLAKAWAVPIRNLVVASVDRVVDVVADHSEESDESSRSRRELDEEYYKAFREEVYRMKSDIFKMMEDHPGPVRSVYAHNHRLIQTELIARQAGYVERELFRLQYSLWSLARFAMVYHAIKKECYTGNDKLNYTLIEGGSYVDDQYLHRIIENADAVRAEACKYYKHSLGVTPEDEVTVVAERFLNLHLSMYDIMVTVPSDVLMIDAVSQYMLGDIEAACLLRFLCHADCIERRLSATERCSRE